MGEAVFENTHFGRITLKKETNTGKDMGGWIFTVFTDEECQTVAKDRNGDDATLTTDSDGSAISNYLAPGTYYVKETGGTYFGDDAWDCSTDIQAVNVVAGSDTALQKAFVNLNGGKISITKTIEGDGDVAGWEFKITRKSDEADMGTFKTGEDGTIVTGNLLPGEYVVEEIIPEDSFFYCKTENPVTVTVSASETAEVGFTNTLKSGQIVIDKTNFLGKKLSGAKFLLEWSDDDGETWTPVVYSDKEYVVKGGTSTEAVTDGCLTTDDTGHIVFENLYPGLMYRITETEAPEGYVKLTDYAFVGELPDDLKLDLTVYNSQGFSLPVTGVNDDAYTLVSIGTGIAIMILFAGMALIAYNFKSDKYTAFARKNKSRKDMRKQ